jgi:inositol transport system ATP-binding protein
METALQPEPGADMKKLLNMKKIRKSFSGVEVLHAVDLDLFAGEVLALIGENGAGKSTLMKVLMGIEIPDSGEITLLGKQVSITSTAQALKLGIAMIHQELYPIPEMTIAENLFLGREFAKFGFVNIKKQERETVKWLKKMDLDISPKTKMKDLSISETQIVEIAKALSYGSQIVIMDEPTSAITTSEVNKLFEVIQLLKSEMIAVIYISHKLDELPLIADRVQILRDGDSITTKKIRELSVDNMIRHMVNREISRVYPICHNKIGETVMEVRALSRKGEFDEVSFSLKKGEKLGIAGLMGAGRSEIVSTIFGDRRADSGDVYLKGTKLNAAKPSDAIKRKIALITEDRKLFGLNLMGTSKDNISTCIDKRESMAGFLNNRKTIMYVDQMIDQLSIKVTSRNQIVENLSGGNQQKVVLAKWLLTEPEIIIFDEPTRGIDVGAKSEIYNLINDLVMQGKSAIIISSEMPELIGISDRIIVMSQGRLKGELNREDFSQEMIMQLAAHSEENQHHQPA